MAYIFEKKIGERLAKAYNKGWPVDLRLVKELDEVYEKAKAFDKVLELHSQHIDTESFYGGRDIGVFPD